MEKLIIRSTGNVGFGPPPTSILEVYSDPKITFEKAVEIGINTVFPSSIIDIKIGKDHFTDKDIRKWSTGNLEDIDWATGQESVIIEYLSQIIVEKILKKPKSEKLVIKSTEHVGYPCTSPTANLEVYSKMESDIKHSEKLIIEGDGQVGYGSPPKNNLEIYSEPHITFTNVGKENK